MTEPQRLRGRKLQERRKRWFAKHPLCVRCHAKGRATIANELDHITPLYKGGQDNESNLQGLCTPCHATKTAADMGYTERQQIGPDGYPVDG